ncbi:MAG: hypothetical protein H8D23_30050 [Candidatus Brocadiales bacterium]|nr:hypothetical protein [Candidatus Brocadiales bacterium]
MEFDKLLYNKSVFDYDDEEIMRLIIDISAESIKAAELKQHLKLHLEANGWLFSYKYHPKLANTITAVRDRTGLCLPLGNVARLFYDLLKLQYCYSEKIIERGIVICPIKPEGNRAYIDRLEREMSIYQSVIDIPLCAIGTNIEG